MQKYWNALLLTIWAEDACISGGATVPCLLKLCPCSTLCINFDLLPVWGRSDMSPARTHMRPQVLPWPVCTKNKGQEGLLCALREIPVLWMRESTHFFSFEWLLHLPTSCPLYLCNVYSRAVCFPQPTYQGTIFKYLCHAGELQIFWSYLELGFLMRDNIFRIYCCLRSCLLLWFCPSPLLWILVHLHWWHAFPQVASSLHDVLLPIVTEAVPITPGGLPRRRDLCASAEEQCSNQHWWWT